MKIVLTSKTEFNSLVTGIRDSFLAMNIKLKLGKFKEFTAHCLGFKSCNLCLQHIQQGEALVIELEDFEQIFKSRFSQTFDNHISGRTWVKIYDNIVSEAQKRLLFTRLQLDMTKYSQRPFFDGQLKQAVNHSQSYHRSSFAHKFYERKGQSNLTSVKPQYLILYIYDNFVVSASSKVQEANLVGSISVNPLLSYAEIGALLSSYSEDIEEVIFQFKSMEMEVPVKKENGFFINNLLPNSEYKYKNSLDVILDKIYDSSVFSNLFDSKSFESYLSKLSEEIKSHAVQLYIEYNHTILNSKV